jgi:hypothetical protein
MAGDILTKKGTKLTWKESGGDAVWTFKNIANGAGRTAARLDLGALTSGRAAWFDWYAESKCQATPTLGALIRYYLALWHDDTTPGDPDGGLGSADAAFATEDKLRNLLFIGSAQADAATASVVFTGAGRIYLPVRYVSLVGWNATGAALTNTAGDHKFTLDPVYENVS